ncbi:CBS domain-containing protein [Gorillibacterium timonense]|uniref:CBS domain-containing protein n=1 Tax=Gorillibacterium timonense TaxID=1689269 RepID=UPI00071D65E6|nr:CBS domain-containing protein [Gorillibacterium timonense]
MNIAFFLLPKRDVVCLTPDTTLRQTLEKMEHHRFTSVPVLNEDGSYLGTITEGDLLWFLKNNIQITFENAHRHSLSEVPLRLQHQAVRIDATMEDLLKLVQTQNFVAVVDDTDRFIGIVRRSEVIDYCAKLILKDTPARI